MQMGKDGKLRINLKSSMQNYSSDRGGGTNSPGRHSSTIQVGASEQDKVGSMTAESRGQQRKKKSSKRKHQRSGEHTT